MKSLRRLSSTLMSMLMLLLTVTGQAAAGDQLLLIKASFVLNFMKFTDWPTTAMAQTDNQITLAVVGDEPLFEAMEETLRGKTVQGRGVRVRAYPNLDTWLLEQSSSHAVFLSAAALQKPDDLQLISSQHAVLTIADRPGFCAAGGMLNLFEDSGRMRFEANPDAVRHAGLTLQAQMLNLAVIVKTVAKE